MFKNQIKTTKALAIAAVLSIFLIYGCTSQPSSGPETPVQEPHPEVRQTPIETGSDPLNEIIRRPSEGLPLWMTDPLKDVSTGATFSLNSFSQPVLVESFAVWCPICTRQQEEVKRLHELRDDIVSVAINTDHNEDEEKVLAHVQQHGFDWRYAVAPLEFTRYLIEEFGSGIVNAPSAPMFLICPDGQTHKLRSGVKSADELSQTVDESCQ